MPRPAVIQSIDSPAASQSMDSRVASPAPPCMWCMWSVDGQPSRVTGSSLHVVHVVVHAIGASQQTAGAPSVRRYRHIRSTAAVMPVAAPLASEPASLSWLIGSCRRDRPRESVVSRWTARSSRVIGAAPLLFGHELGAGRFGRESENRRVCVKAGTRGRRASRISRYSRLYLLID